MPGCPKLQAGTYLSPAQRPNWRIAARYNLSLKAQRSSGVPVLRRRANLGCIPRTHTSA